MTATYFATCLIASPVLLLVVRIVIAALLYAGIAKLLRMEMMEEVVKWVERRK